MGGRIGVIGVGGIGGYYGALLQRSGQDVHFLLRSDYDHVRHHGLIIQSVHGDFALPQVQAYNRAEAMPPCDLVIVAIKATENHRLPSLLAPLLHPETIVVLLQNGLDAEPLLSQALGTVPLIGGLCFICTTRIAPGHIHHQDYGSVLLAQYQNGYQPCGITPALVRVAETFQAAGIPTETSEDLLRSRWQKLVWNIPFNALAVLLNAKTDALMADPQLVDLIRAIMQEVTATAAGYGRGIPDSFIEERLAHTQAMKPYTPSTKVDFDAGRELEVEAIWGNPYRAAQKIGIPTPHLAMLYRQMAFLNAHRPQ